MTVIVGIVGMDGSIAVLADSSGASDNQIFAVRTPKLARLVFGSGDDCREIVIGYTSSYRMGDILRTHLDDIAPFGHMDAEQWMISEFIPAVRGAFCDGGFTERKDGREAGGEFIVAVQPGRMFVVQSDFSVIEPAGGEFAIGAGAAYALGSLHATSGDQDAILRAMKAGAAAEAWSPSVRGPMHIIALKR